MPLPKMSNVLGDVPLNKSFSTKKIVKNKKLTPIKNNKKLFVLDTNVLMHDSTSLFRFQENDVYIPMVTLEELDNHKKGMSEVSRNARQISRTLDALIKDIAENFIDTGIPLSRLGNNDAKGNLFFQTTLQPAKLPEGLPEGKADNQILGVVLALAKQYNNKSVILVSKDINIRIKARAIG